MLPAAFSNGTPIVTDTADGSQTFYSPAFKEAFHSLHGARQEAEAKFVQPTRLREGAIARGTVRILDVCYGLGYNTAAALCALDDLPVSIEVLALEADLEIPRQAIACGLTDIWPPQIVAVLAAVADRGSFARDRYCLRLLPGDARHTLKDVPLGWADAIFLDPFSPPRCPQLWTVEFLGLLAARLHPAGLLATYSCAAAVRSALLAAGLAIAATAPVGRKSPGTLAGYANTLQALPLLPLSEAEREQLQTRAAVPYRDPTLSDTAETIRQRRQAEQQRSPLEPTSQWRRRWAAPRA